MISMVIWAASSGSYNFMLPRKPLVYSLLITGETEEQRGQWAYVQWSQGSVGKVLACQSSLGTIGWLRVTPSETWNNWKVKIPKEFPLISLLLALICSVTHTRPGDCVSSLHSPVAFSSNIDIWPPHTMGCSWEHKLSWPDAGLENILIWNSGPVEDKIGLLP